MPRPRHSAKLGRGEGKVVGMKCLCAVFMIVSVAAALPGWAQISGAGNQAPPEGAERPRVTRASNRPDLGADISQVAKFKLASRKAEYRLGEMITIDAAMLNVADAPVFFRELTMVMRLQALNSKGEKAEVVQYVIPLMVASPDSYSLLKPGEMTADSYDILAGCDDRHFDISKEQFGVQDDRAAFERDRFVTFGQACLDVTRPGTYTLTATVNNDFVMVSPAGTPYKTAAGKISSIPITITITGGP